MKTVGVALGLSLLASAAAHASVYPLPVVPDWVVPEMEAAPAHSGEKFLLAIWVLGFPCPELDDQFAPEPSSYVPPLLPTYVPASPWSPPPKGNIPPVPEPATWLLLAIGAAMIGLRQRIFG